MITLKMAIVRLWLMRTFSWKI